MILADTSIWIDHLRSNDGQLAKLLHTASILIHPFVIGELVLGHLRSPERVVANLRNLPRATTARDSEVLRLIQKQGLSGLGIGYVDAHLMASALLSPETLLWTRDKRLKKVAEGRSLAAPFA